MVANDISWMHNLSTSNKNSGCNVILIVNGVEFQGNRFKLATMSSYFEKMFSGNFKESSCDKVVISGPPGNEILPQTMGLILKFIDNKDITFIDSKNALEILFSADYLDIKQLKSYCIKYLMENLDHQTWVDTYRVANQLNLHDLLLYSYNKLQEILNHVNFKKLSYSEFKGIVESQFKRMNVINVYTAMISWIKAEDGREVFLDELLRFIKFNRMDDDFLKVKVLREQLIINNPYAEKNIHAILMNRKLLVIGGHGTDDSVIKYCPRTKKVTACSSLPYPSDRSAVGQIGSKVLVAGGIGSISEVQVYDIDENTWDVSTSSLETPRWYATGAVANEKFYVVGGFDLVEPMTSIEIFDVNGKTCTPSRDSCLNLKQARSHHAVVSRNNCLFVMGGESCGTILNSCEYIDTSVHEVYSMPPLNGKRAAFAAVIFQDEIIIMGGFDGTNNLSSVEKYSFETNSWTFLPHMLTQRKGHCACVSGGYIYVIGGVGTDSIEVFDPTTCMWSFYDNIDVPRKWCSVIQV